MKVVFAIPLKKPRDEGEAERIDVLLSLTLDSLAWQSSGEHLAVVCGHLRPEGALARHPGAVWLQAPFDPPRGPEEFRADKHRKRMMIAAWLKDQAPFYYMALDGDDLVHRRCVEVALESGGRTGFIFRKGYALDFRTGLMARIPGVWKNGYHRLCGSSSVVYLEPDDLPDSLEDAAPRLFGRLQSHTRVAQAAAKAGRPLAPYPHRGGVYVMNNGVNISYEVIANSTRQETVGDRIAQLAVADPERVLARYVDPARYEEARRRPCFL